MKLKPIAFVLPVALLTSEMVANHLHADMPHTEREQPPAEHAFLLQRAIPSFSARSGFEATPSDQSFPLKYVYRMSSV